MKLTEEVFQAAREASIKALNAAEYTNNPEWSGWRTALEAAADHLPGKLLEPPTDEEVLKVSGGSYKDVLIRFVELRNAPPAPPDWWLEPIKSVIEPMYRGSIIDEVIAAIIAALDAAEGKKG